MGLMSIRIDANPGTIIQIDEIAKKERWSRRKIATVAMEYYLTARGYEVVSPIDREVEE